LCDFFGIPNKAVWGAFAVPIVFLIILIGASFAHYVVAIRSRVSARWGFRFRALALEWEISGKGLVENGRSPDEAAIARDKDNGELAGTLKEHSAFR
jgi:hypothetical protein